MEVVGGDYGPILVQVNQALEQAERYAANENESKMIKAYIESFRFGE